MEKCTFSIVTQKYLACYESILNKMISCMNNSRVNDSVSGNFIVTMIPHHEGGIGMSRNALRFNICPQLKPMLNEMIESQVKGVEEMKKILGCYSE